jgi:hypothetical protein
MLMSEPRDHTEDRNLLESILRRIPGFKGYLEKEYRRESDQLQRQWLADRLLRAKPSIDRLAQPLVEAAQIDILPQLDRLRARIDKVIWQIRSGMQGYSGFFDLVRVDEELLERVYEHDVDLIGRVEALAEAVEALPDSPDQISTALPAAFDAVDAIERELEIRSDMLSGME